MRSYAGWDEVCSGGIVQASANLARWLPVGPLPLRARALADRLGADGYERVMQALSARSTGLDRVMVYRFDAQYNGQVADAREPGMASLHDRHYPASDIPAQARELSPRRRASCYLRNPVRYIPDIDYEPVAVLPWVDAATLQPLGMSHAVLRSVSPRWSRPSCARSAVWRASGSMASPRWAWSGCAVSTATK